MYVFVSTTISLTYSISVGFELQGSEFTTIPSMTSTDIASRAFLQFDDVSAKFSATARVSGGMDIAGVTTLGLDNAIIAFAFGLGIAEITEKIYFKDMSSTVAALRKNAKWLKVGGMDISLPVLLSLEALGETLTINPIISISDTDLLGEGEPQMSIELNIE